jgi:hypothetical protein
MLSFFLQTTRFTLRKFSSILKHVPYVHASHKDPTLYTTIVKSTTTYYLLVLINGCWFDSWGVQRWYFVIYPFGYMVEHGELQEHSPYQNRLYFACRTLFTSTKFLEQTPSWPPQSHSTGQEILVLFSYLYGIGSFILCWQAATSTTLSHLYSVYLEFHGA